MPTNFPTSLDDLSNPTASTSQNAGPRTHSQQHADLNDAVEAMQAVIGVTGSAAPTSLAYKIGQVLGSAGSSVINFLQAGVGAVLMTVQTKLRQHVHVADFGATGAPGVDATAAFNAAINALPASGGVIDVDPDGIYLLSSPLLYFKPILWRCKRGHGDISSNTNGGDAEKPLVYWWSGGGVTGAMLTQQPALSGYALWGGGVEGINFDGSNLAEYAVHINNGRYTTIKGKARNCTAAGLLVSSLAGSAGVFSKKVHVKDWEYVYGVTAATANSHGIRICGNGSTVPSTQHRIDRVFALIKHGAALRIEETDNCQIGSAQAVGDSGSGGGGGAATGCTVWLSNIGSTPAYNNHFDYVSGEVRQESGVFGTTVNQFTAEGGLFKQVSGAPSWHARLVDASGVNGVSKSDAYISHQYRLRKTLLVPAGSLIATAPASSLAGIWPGATLRDATNDTITAMVPIDAELSNGVIEGVTLVFGTNTATAGNYECTLTLSTVALGATAQVVTPERTVTTTLSAGAQYAIKEQALGIGGDLDFTKGDVILCKVERAGGVGNDSATTDVVVLGMRIKYRSKGPQTYDATGILAANMPAWNMP